MLTDSYMIFVDVSSSLEKYVLWSRVLSMVHTLLSACALWFVMSVAVVVVVSGEGERTKVYVLSKSHNNKPYFLKVRRERQLWFIKLVPGTMNRYKELNRKCSVKLTEQSLDLTIIAPPSQGERASQSRWRGGGGGKNLTLEPAM